MSRIRSPRRGANAVEFALIAPVFFLMTFGIIEFGWFFWHKSTTIDAVRSGCRAGSLFAANDIPQNDTAVDVALREMGSRLQTGGVCTSECAIDAYTQRAAGTEFLYCTAAVDYDPLLGFLPDRLVPDVSTARSFVRLELQ